MRNVLIRSVLLLTLAVSALAQADRIRDLTTVGGVRDNSLIGYGLVVGLDGTGDLLANFKKRLAGYRAVQVIRYPTESPLGYDDLVAPLGRLRPWFLCAWPLPLCHLAAFGGGR